MNVREIIDIYEVSTRVSTTSDFFNASRHALYFMTAEAASEYIKKNHLEKSANITCLKAFERCYMNEDDRRHMAYSHLLLEPKKFIKPSKKDPYKKFEKENYSAAWMFEHKDKVEEEKRYIRFSSAAEAAIRCHSDAVIVLQSGGHSTVSGFSGPPCCNKPAKNYHIEYYNLPEEINFIYNFYYLYLGKSTKHGGETRSFIGEDCYIYVEGSRENYELKEIKDSGHAHKRK